MYVYSCFYLLTAESLKTYPAASKLPKATWCGGGEAVERVWRGEVGD